MKVSWSSIPRQSPTPGMEDQPRTKQTPNETQRRTRAKQKSAATNAQSPDTAKRSGISSA